MAALLTTAGIAHLASLDAGTPPAEDMDALIFGAGNDTPALGDTQLQVSQNLGILLRVESGYPVLGDTDPRNTGKAADRYTWKFVTAAGNPFVASNVALTNWNGGVLDNAELVGVHEKVTKYARFDEQLVIFVNAKTGAVPTIVTATQASLVNGPSRVSTWTARARALRAVPNGVRVNTHRVSCTVPRTQSVWTAALLEGCTGGIMRCDEVASVRLTENRWDGTLLGGGGGTRSRSSSLSLPDVVMSSVVTGDARWPGGSYNFAHLWTPQVSASREVAWELVYELRLTDGSHRRIEVEVRVL